MIKNQCMGCQANWPMRDERSHVVVGGYQGESVACTRERYACTCPTNEPPPFAPPFNRKSASCPEHGCGAEPADLDALISQGRVYYVDEDE